MIEGKKNKSVDLSREVIEFTDNLDSDMHLKGKVEAMIEHYTKIVEPEEVKTLEDIINARYEEEKMERGSRFRKNK